MAGSSVWSGHLKLEVTGVSFSDAHSRPGPHLTSPHPQKHAPPVPTQATGYGSPRPQGPSFLPPLIENPQGRSPL
ncbi:hypothetical protein FALCPG4_006544 [Fusarium falciforme]